MLNSTAKSVAVQEEAFQLNSTAQKPVNRPTEELSFESNRSKSSQLS